jgi:peptidoglycan/LPS O-acetylase OafA/YrhL
VPGLEGVRFLAAVSVIFIHATLIAEPLHHGGPAGSWLARTSYLAVDVLFVVSGFAQFLPMAATGPDKLPPWRTYTIRRIARIVPPYWLACVATAIYVGRFGWGWGVPNRSVGLLEFIVHLLFLNHIVFGVVGRNGFGVNSAFWTMTSEALFYVCLPFVAQRFLRHPFWGLAGAFAIAAGWRILALSTGASENFMSQAPAFAFHFAIGMAAAMVVVRCRHESAADQRQARRIRWIAFAALVWGVAAMAAWMRAADPAAHHYSVSFMVDSRWIWNIATTVPIGLLLASLTFAPTWSVLPFSNRVSRWLGQGTYGTYLFHTLILVMIGQKLHDLGFGPMGLWEIGGATAIEALLVGRLSYLVVEEPVRRAAKRTAARLEARAAGTSRRPPRLHVRSREATDAV